MISILIKKQIFFSLVYFVYMFGVPQTFAIESQILSVTPPLFQLSAVPGDIWQSSIKVVNGNSYPISVYSEVVDFEATGEDGRGRFVPILSDESGVNTLAHWVTVTQGPHIIPAEQSKEVSFFVEIPKDAPPGGHYAAILISTEPPSTGEKFAVQTSQAVTSLFFVRIEGDVNESGTVREFRAFKSFLQRPEAEFSLRFENKGNVHLQPRGNIIITNMWGTERGVITLNYQTHFGNVLPKTIRNFTFSCQSHFAITDIGRYKAEVTLAYGEDGVKSVSATAYFWVIPVKTTLITLAIIAFFIWLIVLIVRAYVRKMLLLAGVEISTHNTTNETIVKPVELVKPVKNTYKKVSAPLRSGVLDLRERLSTVNESIDIFKTIVRFILNYKIFFISVCVLIGIFITTVLYVTHATDGNKDYKVIIDDEGTKTILEAGKVE